MKEFSVLYRPTWEGEREGKEESEEGGGRPLKTNFDPIMVLTTVGPLPSGTFTVIFPYSLLFFLLLFYLR